MRSRGMHIYIRPGSQWRHAHAEEKYTPGGSFYDFKRELISVMGAHCALFSFI